MRNAAVVAACRVAEPVNGVQSRVEVDGAPGVQPPPPLPPGASASG